MAFLLKKQKKEDEMKAKKMFLAMVVVLSMLAVFAVSVHAGAWYTCTVNMAGAGWGTNCYIKLSDTAATPAFENRWFVALSSQKKEMLATALTAMTNNMNVWVHIDSPNAYSIIRAMYLISP